MYPINCFKCLLVSSLLLTGQLSTLSTQVFRVSLSFFSLLHWNIRWSTVCMPCLHGHSGLPIIFNRCKYARIFPWPVIIVTMFRLQFIFTASHLSTLGKNSLLIDPFVVSFHWLCHFLMLSFWVSFFYSVLWYPAVRHTVVLRYLLRNSICYFVSKNPGVSFHPFKWLKAHATCFGP